jgi:hypothetical protein
MSMIPTLFTIEGLANELGYDRRTIARALRSVAPDGERKGKPVWRMATALKVLNRRSGGGGTEAAAAEIQETTDRLQAGLDRAGTIANLTERRTLLREVGPLCGQLDRLMEQQDGDDFVRKLLHRECILGVIGQFKGLWSGSFPEQQTTV